MRIIKPDRRAREKPCINCGYSLRNNLEARVCPECGLGVWLSLNPNTALDWSRPAWLAALARAAWVMAAGQLIGLAGLVAWALVSETTTNWLDYAAPLLLVLQTAVYHLGLLLASTDERRVPDQYRARRLTCRVIAIAGLAAAAEWFFEDLQTFRHGFQLYGLGADVIGWVGEAVVLLSGVAAWVYFRALARRVPSPRLARATWVAIVLAVLVWSGENTLAFYFIPWPLIRPLRYAAWGLYPITAAMFVVFGVLFHRCARAAREHWGAETAST